MTEQRAARLKTWQINAVGLLVCAAATVGTYWFGLQPILERRDNIRKQQELLKTQQEKTREASSQLARLVQLKSQLRKMIQDSALQLKPRGYLNRQVAEVSKLAEITGLEVDSLQPGNIERQSRYQTIPIHVAGRGSFVRVVEFLNRMHQEFPDTLVYAMEINGRPESPDTLPAFRFRLNWHASSSSRPFTAEIADGN